MPRFFTDDLSADEVLLTGADAAHLRGPLRARAGDAVTLCDGRGTDADCRITALEDDAVRVQVLVRAPSRSEPPLEVVLYQGLPKGDKLELIIQKAVELGASAIVPVQTARSVAQIGSTADWERRKLPRLRRIAREAAGQSQRGRLPAVCAPLLLPQAISQAAGAPPGSLTLLCYEGGGTALRRLLPKAAPPKVSLFVGPEGGFAAEEVAALTGAGAQTVTLGPRILRCETAPLAALAMLTGHYE